MDQIFTYFTVEKRNQDNGKWELIDRFDLLEPPKIMQKKSFLWFKWFKEIEDMHTKLNLTEETKIEAVKLAKIFAEKEKDVRVLHYKYELLDYGEFFEPTLKSTEIWKNGNWLT